MKKFKSVLFFFIWILGFLVCGLVCVSLISSQFSSTAYEITDPPILQTCDQDVASHPLRAIEYVNLEDTTADPIKQDKFMYSESDVILLASIIQQEAGMECCGDDWQRLVGQVVMNRVNHINYPNTIYDVVTQKLWFPDENRYHYMYIDEYTANWYISHPENVTEMCYNNALAVLNGEFSCPKEVLSQSGWIWGPLYASYELAGYGTMYFCFPKDANLDDWDRETIYQTIYIS